MIGKTLAHYEIVEQLGSGGMGDVYRARDTKLNRDVALKVLPAEFSRDESRRRRFLREAQAIAALKHPNIVTVHAVEEADGVDFIAMELVEGDTMVGRIKPGGVTLDEFFDCAIPLADAISSAHEQGITHRDLKPSNVMFDRDGRLKVLDFGLAKLFSAPTSAPDAETVVESGDTGVGQIVGTTAYMSPEQAEGKPVDHRSDIFSLGIVLYQLATGERPFKGDTQISTISSILKDTPPHISEVRREMPRHVGRIVKRCLEKAPDQRFQSAKDVRNDLEGFKREVDSGELTAETESGVSASPVTDRAGASGGRNLPVPAILGGVVVVAAVLLWSFWPRGDAGTNTATTSRPQAVDQLGPERKLLVVLPFSNIGNESEQEYFADGMTEEMITILGNANPARLGVIARTSAMHYKRKDVSIEDIGQELGVGYILEGSVRRQGEQVRIAAKLINVEDQTQLWSKSFDGTMDDIFVLQSNVANQITEALAVELLGGLHLTNRTHTPDPQAYEEYLAGRFFAHKGEEESWRKAITLYEEAVRIDPEFALAYAALSHAYSAWSGWYTVTSKIAYEKAKEAADEAFRLDPNLADAHSALAVIAAYFEWNWQKVEEQFRVALELNPNDGETYHYYGHYLSFVDRDDESIAAFRNALKFDPLSAYHRNCMGLSYLKQEEIGHAESSINKAQELEPESPLNYYYLGFLRERQDRLDEAIRAWQKAVQYSNRLPTYLATLGYGYGKAGQTDKAHEILEELELKSRDGYVAAMDISKVYAGLGDTDRAFAFLDEAYANRESWILGLKLDPGFDTIRDDPRFLNLLSRIGVEP